MTREENQDLEMSTAEVMKTVVRGEYYHGGGKLEIQQTRGIHILIEKKNSSFSL